MGHLLVTMISKSFQNYVTIMVVLIFLWKSSFGKLWVYLIKNMFFSLFLFIDWKFQYTLHEHVSKCYLINTIFYFRSKQILGFCQNMIFPIKTLSKFHTSVSNSTYVLFVIYFLLQSKIRYSWQPCQLKTTSNQTFNASINKIWIL